MRDVHMYYMRLCHSLLAQAAVNRGCCTWPHHMTRTIGTIGSCGWHMRCIVIRGDAWLVLLSPCSTHHRQLNCQPAGHQQLNCQLAGDFTKVCRQWPWRAELACSPCCVLQQPLVEWSLTVARH